MTTASIDAGAGAYDRFIGRWSRLYVPKLLAAAQITTGQSVLDVATGTGEAAIMAASLVGPSGKVFGVDISLPMLRLAKPKVAGRAITLVAMDGQALAFRNDSFDGVVCQLGLMFFPDVAQGLAEFRRVLRSRGRAGVSVLSTLERVPVYGIIAEILGRYVPSQREVLYLSFALADPHRLEGLLAKAGFHDVSVTSETLELVFESFDDYWSPVEAGGGLSGQAYRGLSEDARRAAREEVRQRVSRFESNGRLVIPMEAHFGVACR